MLPGLPLLGNLLEARRDPLQFIQRLASRRETIVGFRIGTYKGYLLREPQAIRHVLGSNHRNYSKDNLNYRALKPVLGEGLVTSEGALWRRQRQALQPAFQRQELARFAHLTILRTSEMLDRWRGPAEEVRPVDIWSEMTALTLQLISEWLFGTETQRHSSRIKAAFDLLNEDVSFRLRNMYLLPRWVPSPRNRRFQRALAALDEAILGIFEHIKGGSGDTHSLIGRLLNAEPSGAARMSPRQLRDEAVTLVLAGHETTAALLTWSLHLLSTHPDALSRLQAELEQALAGAPPSVDGLISVGYTKRVLEEALRLYPPIWILSRTAAGADRIGGYDIAPGTNLLLSPYATHRHPEYWREPDRFDPDRFSGEQSASRPHFAYFPFGGGPRLCIGRDMAMLEAQLILGLIARHYHLQPVNADQVRPEPLVTLRPEPTPRIIPHAR